MSEKKPKAYCRHCHQPYSIRGLSRHIKACQARQADIKAELANVRKARDIFLLKFEAFRDYVLYVEIEASRTLADLDRFLRDIWLECCGHLSHFEIMGVFYMQQFDDAFSIFEMDTERLDRKLADVLGPGLAFAYEYDFGSTTALSGKMLDVRQGKFKEKVKILARNEPPAFVCNTCGELATTVCVECYQVYCDACANDHGCDDEMHLPLVNSPRTGVCGYDGEYDTDRYMPPVAKG